MHIHSRFSFHCVLQGCSRAGNIGAGTLVLRARDSQALRELCIFCLPGAAIEGGTLGPVQSSGGWSISGAVAQLEPLGLWRSTGYTVLASGQRERHLLVTAPRQL